MSSENAPRKMTFVDLDPQGGIPVKTFLNFRPLDRLLRGLEP